MWHWKDVMRKKKVMLQSVKVTCEQFVITMQFHCIYFKVQISNILLAYLQDIHLFYSHWETCLVLHCLSLQYGTFFLLLHSESVSKNTIEQACQAQALRAPQRSGTPYPTRSCSNSGVNGKAKGRNWDWGLETFNIIKFEDLKTYIFTPWI